MEIWRKLEYDFIRVLNVIMLLVVNEQKIIMNINEKEVKYFLVN